MRFGVHYSATAETPNVREVGRLLEAHGFESLFLPEHPHLPVRGASIRPSGPELHDRLRRFLDPFVAGVPDVCRRSSVRSTSTPGRHGVGTT